MKRKTKKNKNILTVLLVLVGLVAVAGITFVCFKFLGFDKMLDNKKNNNTVYQTTDSGSRSPAQTSPAQAEPTTPNNYQEKQPIVQYSGDNPNDAGELSGVITYTGVVNDTFAIRVNIDQYVNEGTCTLTLTGAQTNYVEAARVVDAASTATCEGFNVPLSQINDNSVRIYIEINADGKKGIISGDATL